MTRDKDTGEVVETHSAAEARAKLIRAARLHEARLIAGHDDEESVEAEAGAFLEAETAVEIRGVHEMIRAWLEAQARG